MIQKYVNLLYLFFLGSLWVQLLQLIQEYQEILGSRVHQLVQGVQAGH